MNPILLLEPMTYLRHDPAQGFTDSAEAFEYKGAEGCVRFDKSTGRVTLDPPGADVLALLQALQALATAQHDAEKAWLMARLRQRPF